MTVRRENPNVLKVMAARLKDLDGQVGKAGWFPGSVYENGLPVAQAAYQNEYGANIAHPGGTPYKIGADGKAIFVSKAEGAGLPVTKPHTIHIPPRPFMRPTADRETKNWTDIMAQGALACAKGSVSGYQVMDRLVQRAAGDIAKSISQVFSPPLKASTIAARRRAKADKKTIGSLTKPLVASGKMIDEVSGVVEKGNGE